MISDKDPIVRFYHFLTTATKRFDLACAMLSGRLMIMPDKIKGDVVESMLESFLFLCTRAERIARLAPEAIQSVGVNTTEFVPKMKSLPNVRNVTEHWSDPDDPRPRKMHDHITKQGLPVGVDELSLVFYGEDEVFRGPLNLAEVNAYIRRTIETIHENPPKNFRKRVRPAQTGPVKETGSRPSLPEPGLNQGPVTARFAPSWIAGAKGPPASQP